MHIEHYLSKAWIRATLLCDSDTFFTAPILTCSTILFEEWQSVPIDGVTGILEDSLQSLWEYFIAYLQRCEFGSNQSADVLSKNYKSNKYKFL